MAIRTAVALFVHKRIEFLPALLEEIRRAAPPRIYVFGDGPKTEMEANRCSEVRQLIERHDLPCPIIASFSRANMGLSNRLISGIDSVFRLEERAIFVEDDIALSPFFFAFCDQLLERYRHDVRVAMISGVNPLGVWDNDDGDYFFSAMGNAQAWASWRRAWSNFTAAPHRWREPRTRAFIKGFLDDPEQYEYHCDVYNLPVHSPLNSWDYQWQLARQSAGTVSIVPVRNLAAHAGRGTDATNVVKRTVLDALVETYDLPIPLEHPGDVAPDRAFDRLVFEATHDRLSPASARRLASALITRGRNLLAAALLRHAYRDIEMDKEAIALMRVATSWLQRP